MHRFLVVSLLVLPLATATPTLAQEVTPGPGTVELTVIPAGGTFFTAEGPGPEFGNYTYGGALTFNINQFVGIEGEVGGSAGITQDLEFGGLTSHLKTPNTLTYSGNVVVSASGRSVVPFATAGVGGLTLFERAALEVNRSETFLVGNVGGGLKWYAPNGRWGLRGDYRFIAVQSKDDAPAFFGQDNRYGHRVYAGVVINAMR